MSIANRHTTHTLSHTYKRKPSNDLTRHKICTLWISALVFVFAIVICHKIRVCVYYMDANIHCVSVSIRQIAAAVAAYEEEARK